MEKVYRFRLFLMKIINIKDNFLMINFKEMVNILKMGKLGICIKGSLSMGCQHVQSFIYLVYPN
jgi:hypothetical protein